MHSKPNCLHTSLTMIASLKYHEWAHITVNKNTEGQTERNYSLLISQSVVVVAVIALIIHTFGTISECHNASALITKSLPYCFLNDKKTFIRVVRSTKSSVSRKCLLIGPKRKWLKVSLVNVQFVGERILRLCHEDTSPPTNRPPVQTTE